MQEKSDRLIVNALLDIEAVAEQLGVTVRHVRRLVAERRIPFVKWGHLIRFNPNDINDWIQEHTQAALNDTQIAGVGFATRTR